MDHPRPPAPSRPAGRTSAGRATRGVPPAAPFFSPPGWDPGIGLDTAIGLLGWTCRHGAGGSGTEAAARLGEASESRPLLAGPLEFGLLLHHPDSGTAIGSDHYVVVTGVEDGIVCFHDPHGHPYATLPADDFIAAWRPAWRSSARAMPPASPASRHGSSA